MQDFNTIPEMIQSVINTYMNSSALNYKVNGRWKKISSERFYETVRRLTLGLRALGVKENDGFAIISSSSPQWIMMDLAIMLNRAISVPLFANVSSDHFNFQKQDSNIHFIFINDSNLLADSICDNLKSFDKVISLDANYSEENGLSYQKLLKLGDQLSIKKP